MPHHMPILCPVETEITGVLITGGVGVISSKELTPGRGASAAKVCAVKGKARLLTIHATIKICFIIIQLSLLREMIGDSLSPDLSIV